MGVKLLIGKPVRLHRNKMTFGTFICFLMGDKVRSISNSIRKTFEHFFNKIPTLVPVTTRNNERINS